jgi:hypothetical protein
LSGDVDLYIKQNAKPEINDYDSMLPLNGNVVHLSLNSLIFNAFQVEASLFNPCNNNTAFGGDSLRRLLKLLSTWSRGK